MTWPCSFDAVRQRRVTHNVAEHLALPAEIRAERPPWTAAQAVKFLNSVADDRLAPLFETLIGTGLRRGEVLALRWADVDLAARNLMVGVGLSARVVTALRAQRARQDIERAAWGEGYTDGGLVFAREDGSPIRPEFLLTRFTGSLPTPACPGPTCTTCGTWPRRSC